jgi:hypothetical protein
MTDTMAAEELKIVTPQRVARGQQWYAHLKRPTPERGLPVYKALCGSMPSSGWNESDSNGRRCQRCEARARKLDLTIPSRW